MVCKCVFVRLLLLLLLLLPSHQFRFVHVCICIPSLLEKVTGFCFQSCLSLVLCCGWCRYWLVEISQLNGQILNVHLYHKPLECF